MHSPPGAVDLNELVRSTLSMLRRLAGEDVDLVTDLCEDVPTVEVDPTGVEQILVNLAVNACDACPDGGTVRIGTRTEVIKPGAGSEAPDAVHAGRYAVLEVADDGIGMDPGTAERIFEPFFTTKSFGEGSGLGLSTVYGIVEQTGGAIEVDSEPGRGTAFRVWFPAADGATAPAG